MLESSDPESAETSDCASLPVSQGPPTDVLEIVAALDDEGSEGTPPVSDDAVSAPASEDVSGDTRAAVIEPPEQLGQGEQGEQAEQIELTQRPSQTEAETATHQPPLPQEPAAGEPLAEPAAAPPPTADVLQEGRTRVPNWPFVAYVIVWIAAGAGMGWALAQTTPGLPVFGTELYRTVVTAGLVLTAIGPILVLVVWLTLLLRDRGSTHAGLFTGALMRGALATLCGVAIWWVALVIVDTVRLGRPF